MVLRALGVLQLTKIGQYNGQCLLYLMVSYPTPVARLKSQDNKSWLCVYLIVTPAYIKMTAYGRIEKIQTAILVVISTRI